jgi:DNA-binding response OmpR family regulator
MARVLVIDDDELFVKLMAQALKARGHEVECAHDGEAGEAAMETVPFDAVVCDLVMPRQEGLETIRYMRRKNPALAVVAISGGLGQKSGLDILKMAELMGAHVSLRKPFQLSELTAAVDQAVAAARSAAGGKASAGA